MSLVRAEVVRVIESRGAVTVIGADGVARRFEAESAELLRAVLDRVRAPISREALRARVAEMAGVDPATPEAQVIDDAIGALLAAGVLVRAPAAPAVEAQAPPPTRARIVLGISGAVAAIDAPVLVRTLLARGFVLEIAATPKALRFVGAAGLEALTHRPVHRRVWERTDRQRVPHVTLAEWADLVVVCPASATTLSRIAAGDCSDLVAAICVTTRAPVVLAPSMNEAMYDSPSVQRNLRALAADGMHLLHPTLGHEVAHAPDDRRAMFGAAAPARVIADAVDLVLRTDPRATRAPELPASPEGWDALHALPPERLPWHTEALDPDLAELLDRARGERAPATTAPRLLDLGAGAGTAAIAASERGFEVVATDVSATALGRARKRAAERPITWVLDDVRRSTVSGTFDVILDRACLHCLPREDWPAYARTVDRLAAAGGWLLIKSHAPAQPRALGTHAPTPEDLAALLPAFELVQQRESILDGPVPNPPRALLSLFRKRA